MLTSLLWKDWWSLCPLPHLCPQSASKGGITAWSWKWPTYDCAFPRAEPPRDVICPGESSLYSGWWMQTVNMVVKKSARCDFNKVLKNIRRRRNVNFYTLLGQYRLWRQGCINTTHCTNPYGINDHNGQRFSKTHKQKCLLNCKLLLKIRSLLWCF